MISVSVFNNHPRNRIGRKAVERYVRSVLRAERKGRARIAVVFVTGAYSRRINRKYLGHDYGTDVLAFPLEEGATVEGEIYVNLDKARQQARGYGVSFAEETVRLVVHGTLHLVGYGDRTPRTRRVMQAREDALLAALIDRPASRGKE